MIFVPIVVKITVSVIMQPFWLASIKRMEIIGACDPRTEHGHQRLLRRCIIVEVLRADYTGGGITEMVKVGVGVIVPLSLLPVEPTTLDELVRSANTGAAKPEHMQVALARRKTPVLTNQVNRHGPVARFLVSGPELGVSPDEGKTIEKLF
jgi:hypothetical protein